MSPATTPAEVVAAWNRDNRPGRAVSVRRDDGTEFRTVTRTEAFLCYSGMPSVFLAGVSGFYLLERVGPAGRPDAS